MSKPSSGLFGNTKGAKKSNKSGSQSNIPSGRKLTNDAKSWADNRADKLSEKSKRQRDKFNTATVVYDVETGKEFYGRNHGIEIDHAPKNKILFGDGKKPGLLPTEKIAKYDIGNCAEVDAVNKALNHGAKLKNLVMKTIHTTKSSFGENKVACANCTATFKGKIKKNYSGWSDNDE